jgi:hypothetical protein
MKHRKPRSKNSIGRDEIGKQNGNNDGVLEYIRNDVIKKYFEKNNPKTLLSEIKVLPLSRQSPPRFPLTSVPGWNFYFIPI